MAWHRARHLALGTGIETANRPFKAIYHEETERLQWQWQPETDHKQPSILPFQEKTKVFLDLVDVIFAKPTTGALCHNKNNNKEELYDSCFVVLDAASHCSLPDTSHNRIIAGLSLCLSLDGFMARPYTQLY